jgi:hypothetical protein
MDDPITARYEWGPPAMAEALVAHQRHSLRPIFRGIVWFVILIYFAGSIGIPLLILAAPSLPPEIKRNAVIVLAVAILIWSFLLWANRTKAFFKWRARRAFRSLPGGPRVVEWSFGPQLISNRTQLSASTLLWPLFLKVVESPSGFLLYQQKNFFNWIPANAFVSESEMKRFAELARGHVPLYIVVSPCRFAGKPASDGFEEI